MYQMTRPVQSRVQALDALIKSGALISMDEGKVLKRLSTIVEKYCNQIMYFHCFNQLISFLAVS